MWLDQIVEHVESIGAILRQKNEDAEGIVAQLGNVRDEIANLKTRVAALEEATEEAMVGSD